jgi:Rieske Fe-S protein
LAEQSLANAEITRRRLLSWGIGAIGAAMAALIGVPAVKYLAHPALEAEASNWAPVADLSEIKPGQPALFKVSIEKKSGWLKTTSEESVYVDTVDGKTFSVISNHCTHLGCPVRWDSGRNAFLCPCHNGVFDRKGNVVAGPPPRPLDRFQTKVEGGKLFIMGGQA